MNNYITNIQEVKAFRWDGFIQTLYHNIPQKSILRDFEYDNDSLFINTENGFQHCPIGYYIVFNLSHYLLMSPTQFHQQYKKI